VDWPSLRCLTLIGSSHRRRFARNTVMQDFATAWSNGAKVIVVDPRFSSVAAKADYWLPIKPGTDTALLLAWMQRAHQRERYDKAYVAEWTDGFESWQGACGRR
jgi:thiosulfate reductase / polysulfide reductase chain A